MGKNWKKPDQSSSVPVSQNKLKPKIITRRTPKPHKFIQAKPYLNTYQVFTAITTIGFFIGSYYWIK